MLVQSFFGQGFDSACCNSFFTPQVATTRPLLACASTPARPCLFCTQFEYTGAHLIKIRRAALEHYREDYLWLELQRHPDSEDRTLETATLQRSPVMRTTSSICTHNDAPEDILLTNECSYQTSSSSHYLLFHKQNDGCLRRSTSKHAQLTSQKASTHTQIFNPHRVAPNSICSLLLLTMSKIERAHMPRR